MNVYECLDNYVIFNAKLTLFEISLLSGLGHKGHGERIQAQILKQQSK